MFVVILLLAAALLFLYAVLHLTPRPRSLSRGHELTRTAAVVTTSTVAVAATPDEFTTYGASNPSRGQWLLARFGRRVLALVAAGGLLLCVLIQLWLDHTSSALPMALVALLLCGAVVALALASVVLDPPLESTVTMPAPAASPTEQQRMERRLLPALVVVAAIGLACAVAGALKVAADPWRAQALWFAAMGLPAVVLIAGRPMGRLGKGATASKVNPADAVSIIGLFLFALILRVPAIDTTIPFMHGDEAACGVESRTFNTGQAPLLGLGWYNLPRLSYALTAPALRVFGDTLTGLRLGNAVIGALGVALLYVLARELFARRVALLAGVILSLTFLDLDLSRDGIHYIQGPTAITLTLYLVVRSLRRGGALTAYLAGLSLIVDLQVYFSARAAFILVLCLLALMIVSGQRRLIMARWREATWVLVGLVTAGLPLMALFLANPGSFDYRQAEVNALGDNGHVRSVYGTNDLIPVLTQQTWRTVTTFVARGDASEQIGWGGSMLDTVSAALFVAALVLALLRWRRWQYALPLAWVALVVGAGVTTIDPPWWPRLAALLPAVALLLAALLSEVVEAIRVVFPRYLPHAITALAVVIATIAIGNLRLLFVDYPATARQAGAMTPTLIGQFLARAPGADRTVLLTDGSFDLDYVTIRFLAPRSGGCALTAGQPLDACPAGLGRTSTLYVVLPGRLGDIAWLRRQRPGGTVAPIDGADNGGARLVAYELSASR